MVWKTTFCTVAFRRIIYRPDTGCLMKIRKVSTAYSTKLSCCGSKTTCGTKSGSNATGPTEIKNVDPPSSIYKNDVTSPLGPGAGKDKEYKNPEYYSFHNMSYYDMEPVMANLRLPQPNPKPKK